MRIKVTCGVMSLHLPAVHPPSVPREHWELEPDGEVSGSGCELGTAQMRSCWMLQNRTRFPRAV